MKSNAHSFFIFLLFVFFANNIFALDYDKEEIRKNCISAIKQKFNNESIDKYGNKVGRKLLSLSKGTTYLAERHGYGKGNFATLYNLSYARYDKGRLEFPPIDGNYFCITNSSSIVLGIEFSH